MKKFLARFKAIAAVVASFALVVGGVTAIDVLVDAAPAHAAAGPFTCTSDFYQVSDGQMYQYSVSSNTYSLMSNSLDVSGLNSIGYNTADNYIYGISGTKLYQIANDGSQVAATTITGTAQSTGGDFIAPNELLSASNGGVFSLTNVTTHTATAFTATGSTWKAYDLAFNPTNTTIYGMTGTTLDIGKVTGTSSVAVTTKAVTGSLAGTGDAWGAAYVDSAGDAYFFDNTTFDLVEISAAGLASATPSAISITQANSLSSPNDGASCPTASSPLAPTVVTGSATSISTTGATLGGTVATGIPTGSDVPSGGIVMCYSTSNTLVNGALSVSPVCAPTTPSTLPLNTAATAVSLGVSGLASNTTYYYQLEATNTDGLEAFGSVANFTTSALPNHTVTFNNNGGTGTMASEVDNTATPLTTNTFTRAGYSFSGWATTSGGSVVYADGASYPFTADATLYAVWTALPNQTVTFNNNGGTGTMSNEVDNVATPLTADTFTRAGYSFSGWATSSGGSVVYTDGASYPFTSSATLYAVWTALPNHTVTFNNNGGTGTMSNEVDNVSTPLTTNTFTRAGYSFSGWATSSGGAVVYADGASYPFTVDITLYAVWTALPNQTVTFNNNGGTGTMANEVDNVSTPLTTNTFTRAGYSFAGWATTSGGSVAYTDGASYPFTSSATLYAVWTALPNHTVTFNNNGGSGTMSNEVDNVSAPLTTNTFTRAGYSFAGWATTSGGSVAYTDGASYAFTADATLYAVWTALPNHTVTFDNNGGTGTMSNEVDNVSTPLTTNTFSRAGYSFAGWATTSGGSVVYADGASYPFTSDATLYAVWTALPNHTVTFDKNGGSGTMSNEVDNVSTPLTTNTFTRAGYSFAGWATTSGGSVVYADGASYPFTADASLYAVWTALPNHTVTFDNNGGTGSMTDEVDNVSTPLSSNTFTRSGYTFVGWATTSGGSVAYADGASYPFTSDATLYAVWTAIPNQTVTFDNNGGSGSMSNQVDNVSTPLTTNTFTRAGYTFAGWATTSGGSVAYADGASYPFTSSATLYAVWTALPNHTVTFDNNGGTGTMANEVDNVSTPLTTNTFTRSGYTFAGWATTSGGSVVYADAASYPFTADATLYAQWTVIPNSTVTFDPNGGSGLMANEVDNVPTDLTANTFTRAGYTFAGWATTSGGTVAYADAASYPFSSSGTLYAVWTAIPDSTVTFDSNGGSGGMANELDNVPTDLTANTFTKAGYNFAGWNTAQNGSGASYADTSSYAFNADATMYAQWSLIPVLSFDPNGGDGSVPSMSSDVPTNLPTTTVTRPGYKFIGWNTSPDGTGTEYAPGAVYPFSSSGVLYAQFTKIILATTGVDPTPGITLAMLLILLGLMLSTTVAVVRRVRGRRTAS